MKAGRPGLLGLRLRWLPLIGGIVTASWPDPRAQNLLVLGARTAAWGLVVTMEARAGGLKICGRRLHVTGDSRGGWLEAVLRTCWALTETRRDELRFHSMAAVPAKSQVCLKQN